jgi:phage baseplate assembly protein W
MAKLSKIYSDIDFTFTQRPVVGDIALSYDDQAVIRSIRNLLLTNHFERPFNPNLGSNIEALLFELGSQITATSIQNEISTTITNYEPRAQLDEVDVTFLPDKNAYSVKITAYISNNTLPTNISLILQRDR